MFHGLWHGKMKAAYSGFSVLTVETCQPEQGVCSTVQLLTERKSICNNLLLWVYKAWSEKFWSF